MAMEGPIQHTGNEHDDHEAEARVSSREALRFLTRAGRTLAASLDPEQTLTRLVQLAVPRVACFAMIDLVREAGWLERVGYRHIDPAIEPLLVRAERFRPEDSGVLPIAQVLDDGTALMIEHVEHDRDVSDVVLERLRRIGGRSLIIVPLEAHGRRLGTLTLGSTRTDRHYRQADLSLAREFARSASVALENARLYRQAEQAIAARDDMLAVVSHDLRNPVNRVRLAAELLLETDVVAPQARRTVDMVIRAADEMNRLIGDLLDVARIESGTLSIQPAPIDLEALLQRIDESHAPGAHQRGLVWRVESPPTPATLHADQDRLLQALGNLVGNATKFTPEGGQIRIDAVPADTTVRLGVHDNGPGMDENQLAHVFDRFWQGRSGDRRGAGLGLAIARGIAQAHSGRLWLESEPGRGTSAWLELPRRSSASPAGRRS
jgi:signal transduction histidine kinase